MGSLGPVDQESDSTYVLGYILGKLLKFSACFLIVRWECKELLEKWHILMVLRKREL